MGWVWFLICVVSVYLTHGTSIFWLAVVNALLNVWSFGVMWNYRMEPWAIPKAWTPINMSTSILGAGLLLYGLIA